MVFSVFVATPPICAALDLWLWPILLAHPCTAAQGMSYAANAHYTPALGGVWREVLHGRRLHTAHRRRRVYGRGTLTALLRHWTMYWRMFGTLWDHILRYIEACIGPWKMFILDLPVSDTQIISDPRSLAWTLTNSPISPLWLLVNPYYWWFPHAWYVDFQDSKSYWSDPRTPESSKRPTVIASPKFPRWFLGCFIWTREGVNQINHSSFMR